YRNKVDVGEDPQLKGRHNVIPAENSFIISKPKEEDAGKFTCEIPELGESKEFNVVAKMYFKQIPHSTAVVEGEKLKLHCIAYGTDPEIKWVIGDEVYEESRGRIVLAEDERKIKNAVLYIDNVVLEDRKTYNCTGTNIAIKFGNANYTEAQEYVYVRVKGKLAALWPFLGICAEVFVLCAIILIYEKRRNKAELEESDTDQSPE
ncbi:Basigin, partial [Pseudolycoriella hygida]